MMIVFEVVVPGLFRSPLLYQIHPEEPTPVVGQCVRAPLKKRIVTGIVWHIRHIETVPAYVRFLETIDPNHPIQVLHAQDIALYRSILDYYHYPIGLGLFELIPEAWFSAHASSHQETKHAFDAQTQKKKNNTDFPDATLSDDQKQVVHQIVAHLHHFKTFLLEGVTGSGKTAVYVEIAKQTVMQGKQVLVLVPEIHLTPQTLARFQSVFQDKIVIWHSKCTQKTKIQYMKHIQSGQCSVIIGTRSAVALPIPHLGLIVVDEEHDSSFKQQNQLRYSARDMAVLRGHHVHIPVVLGSATPSLESIANAKSGRYIHLFLKKRMAMHAPTWHVLDIRARPLIEGMDTRTLKMIEETLEKNHQVLVFINRRGFSPAWSCSACGWICTCPHCDARLTFHQQTRALCCHHCGDLQPVMPTCLACQSPMSPIGHGTERIFEYLKKTFPHYPCLCIDRDHIKSEKDMKSALNLLHTQQPCLVIGTQMIAKGHDFPHMTLSILLNIDACFYSQDFKSLEHGLQTIVQVGGRAGRAHLPGTIVVQTMYPDHPYMPLLQQQDYTAIADHMLRDRALAQLPPYSYIAILWAESKTPHAAEQWLDDLKKQHLHSSSVDWIGPFPGRLSKRAGYYRYQIIFKHAQRSALHIALRSWMPFIDRYPRHLKIALDLDPWDV